MKKVKPLTHVILPDLLHYIYYLCIIETDYDVIVQYQ